MVVASRQQPFMYRIGCSFTLRGKPDLSPPMMNFYEFKESLAKTKPPAELTPALAALWWAGEDNWERAHNIVMVAAGKDSAWVNAYWNLVEGDLDSGGLRLRSAEIHM